MPVGDRPAFPLEKQQVLQILRHQNPKTRSGCRNRAIVSMLWRCGLRNSELRNVELEHLIRGPERAVRVMRPKGIARGAKPRNLGLEPETWRMIQQWIADFRGVAPGPLFNTRVGTRIDDRNLRRMIAGLARQAGITRRVHPHCFRHTFAHELYDEGVDLMRIRDALGHTNVATTEKYLRYIGCGEHVSITAGRGWKLHG